MNKQEKAWETRRAKKDLELCVVCGKNHVSSNKSKTCCRVCAAKLAWITGKKKEVTKE